MDLHQRKLTKAEWNSIEKPLSADEISILKMITAGYNDVNISTNHTIALQSYLKTTDTKYNVMECYIYFKYLKKPIDDLYKKYKYNPIPVKNLESKVKKTDMIRIQNMDKQIKEKTNLFEFILLDLLKQLLRDYKKKNYQKWTKSYYTIQKLLSYNITNLNSLLKKAISHITDSIAKEIDIKDIFENSHEIIEKNEYILKYADERLYEHQKKLYTLCKKRTPKLILYTAPTGTGKTMSPLGLSETNKIIFVCAARHVGLALAKAAIAVDKKIAFAFGCSHSADIRLHYYAAKDYTKDWFSGGIRYVDNTNGEKVEIMICDIKSYIPAMYYMCSFNNLNSIITYWDEPTITMDYDEHEFHSLIQKNWQENIIPTMILSSATLPHKNEINDVIVGFKCKFDNAQVYTIESYDCKKSISLFNKEGYAEMPHYVFTEYDEMRASVKHMQQYKTLLRYLDLKEIVKLIMFINQQDEFKDLPDYSRYSISSYFTNLNNITMNQIKLYYLDILENINENIWDLIQTQYCKSRKIYYKSTILVTTSDAHTLTDGPTIFLSADVDKIAEMCVQTANINPLLLKRIMASIEKNNTIQNKISSMEKIIEDKMKDSEDKVESGRMSSELRAISNKIEDMRNAMTSVELDEVYVPNTNYHLKRWAPEKIKDSHRAYTPLITSDIIERIMQINDIEDNWKLLLMMGIGVFGNQQSITYNEIMKELAYNQQLYLIIADADYIYGTNYQFCHGYISKDLECMTQEKCIQAMGRIGRNKLQYDYSIRFRENNLFHKIFMHDDNKPEVKNMNRLFVCE
jgi:hypothetical protein